jgi:hypothetical protein
MWYFHQWINVVTKTVDLIWKQVWPFPIHSVVLSQPLTFYSRMMQQGSSHQILADFQVSRTMRNIMFLFISYQVFDILLQQDKTD